MPINIRLTAIPAPAGASLAAHLATVTGAADDGADIVVAVQGAETAGLEPYLGSPAADVLAACDATGKAGEVTPVAMRAGDKPRRLLFVGLGDESAADLRKAGAALGSRVAPERGMLAAAVLGRPAGAVRAFAEGLLLGSYRFSLASQAAPGGPGEVRLLVPAGDEQAAEAVTAACTVAGAVGLARDLVNMPSGRKTPAWLAGEAAAAAAASGLTVRVREPAELAAEGFGGILAVGSGSAQPPCLIELGYHPPGARTHVVLVGKGITFDSGGLSLKPNEGMKTMKTDMAGGAAVIAAMSALAGLRAAVRVTGLVATAENMPSGSAMRPGDVITHFGGRTTEVLNTDAEGRLVLADALAYADTVLEPDVMVDVATLTGAARVALGGTLGALYASDDGLAGALLAAAAEAGEPLWRMPLVDDYSDALDSPVADLANIPHSSRPRAGSIEAALFLREFTGGRRWAHLDIAGAARFAPDGGEAKGGTGFGTRLLLRWLLLVEQRLRQSHRSLLDRGQQAVAHRQQQRDQPLVLADRLDHLPDGRGFRVGAGRGGDPPAPQRVVEGHDAAGPQQAQGGGQVARVVVLVRVAEDDVVAPIGEAGQYVRRLAADEPVPVGREARLDERLARQPLMLRVDIDAGQDPVGTHAAEQPDTRGAAAGADLDHRPGGHRGGDEPQGRARGRADRRRPAHVGGVAPSHQQRLVLREVPFHEIQGGLSAHDAPSSSAYGAFPGRSLLLTRRAAGTSRGTLRVLGSDNGQRRLAGGQRWQIPGERSSRFCPTLRPGRRPAGTRWSGITRPGCTASPTG